MRRIEFVGEEFFLLPEKVLFWPGEDCLLLSDLHLGKALHFRKNGLALPQAAEQEDYVKLRRLFEKFASVKTIYFLGDLFHSEKNLSFELFRNLIGSFPEKHFVLVPGNHDIIPPDQLRSLGLELTSAYIRLKGIYLSHDENHGRFPCISGHIHPGALLSGIARQSIRLPAFLVEPHRMILPSFGELTGTVVFESSTERRLYAVFGEEILDIPVKGHKKNRR